MITPLGHLYLIQRDLAVLLPIELSVPLLIQCRLPLSLSIPQTAAISATVCKHLTPRLRIVLLLLRLSVSVLVTRAAYPLISPLQTTAATGTPMSTSRHY